MIHIEKRIIPVTDPFVRMRFLYVANTLNFNIIHVPRHKGFLKLFQEATLIEVKSDSFQILDIEPVVVNIA